MNSTNDQPLISIGTASAPLTITLSEECLVFCHVDADGTLWLGADIDDPDLLLETPREAQQFAQWLRALPADPHCNTALSLIVPGDRPRLVIEACIGFDDSGGKRIVIGTLSLASPFDATGFTSLPPALAPALAAAIEQISAALVSGELNVEPTRNIFEE